MCNYYEHQVVLNLILPGNGNALEIQCWIIHFVQHLQSNYTYFWPVKQFAMKAWQESTNYVHIY